MTKYVLKAVRKMLDDGWVLTMYDDILNEVFYRTVLDKEKAGDKLCQT